MNLASTRKALGVSPNITFSPVSWEVNSAFAASGDDLQPASYHIEALLNRGIRVLLYVGKQDFSCNWVGNLKMAEHLEWHGQQGFLDTEPSDWTSKNGSTVGWSKTFGDLNFVVVDNAGHMVRSGQSLLLCCLLIGHFFRFLMISPLSPWRWLTGGCERKGFNDMGSVCRLARPFEAFGSEINCCTFGLA